MEDCFEKIERTNYQLEVFDGQGRLVFQWK